MNILKPILMSEKFVNNSCQIYETITAPSKNTKFNHSHYNQIELSTNLSIRILFRKSETSTALLILDGSLLKSNLQILLKAFNECLSQKKNTIIIDMNKVNNIDKVIWHLLINEQNQLKNENAEFFLFGLNPEMKADAITYCKYKYGSLQIFSTIIECQKVIESYGKYQKNSHSSKSKTTPPADQNVCIEDNDTLTFSQKSPNYSKTVIPVSVKITAIISLYGPCSVQKIFSLLHSDEFDNVEIGLFDLKKILKEMNLDSKEKRERFFRTT